MEEDIYKYKGGFSDPVTLALLGASAGFLDPRGGMQGGFQGAMQGLMAGRDMRRQDMMDKQTQAKLTRDLAARQQLNEIVQQHQGGNPASIANAILATGNPDLMQYAQQFRSGMPKVKSTFDVMKDGKMYRQTVMDDGSYGDLNAFESPEKLMQVNTGDKVQLVGQNTATPRADFGVNMAPGERARLAQSERQFGMSHGLARENAAISRQNNDLQRQRLMLEMDPEYQAQRAGMIAGAKEQATGQVKAQRDLPNVIQQGETTIGLVDDLLAHPGFKISVGKSAPIGKLQSFMPGTQAASFDIALKQLKGKQFLEAFESLKGGGQITQIEGEKATQAMSRMETANTEQEFEKAAREFQGIIRNGINRAKLRTGNSPQQSQPQTSSDGWGELR